MQHTESGALRRNGGRLRWKLRHSRLAMRMESVGFGRKLCLHGTCLLIDVLDAFVGHDIVRDDISGSNALLLLRV
jgi:hypothetical protein